MCECDVLLIDDIGNEYMSEFVHEALSIVINTRYVEHNKDNPRSMKTVFTSNYNPRELHNLWSEKIGKGKSLQLISRLKDFGVIEMKGRNWRK
jgi:DNA replication protein DnaC